MNKKFKPFHISSYPLFNIPLKFKSQIIDENNILKEIINSDTLFESKIEKIIELANKRDDDGDDDDDFLSNNDYSFIPVQKDGYNFITDLFKYNIPVIYNTPPECNTHSLFIFLIEKYTLLYENNGKMNLPSILIINEEDIEYYQFLCYTILKNKTITIINEDLTREYIEFSDIFFLK